MAEHKPAHAAPKAEPKAEMSDSRKELLAAHAAGKPNLTRLSLEGYFKSKLVAEGKSVDEAEAFAKKRAAEMVKD